MIQPHSQKTLTPDAAKYYINKLKAELPAKPALHNYPFDYFFQPGFGKEIPQDYQFVADKMCEFLQLPFKIKVLMLDNMQHAGKFEKMERLQHIFISNDSIKQSADQKLATLAHEITHSYLFHHNIYLEEELKNEILTDIAAVYLGFGNILFKGYHAYFPGLDKRNKKRKIDPYTQSYIGYIDILTIRNAIVLIAECRKQNPLLVANGIMYWHNKLFVRVHLDKMVKEYKRYAAKENIEFKENLSSKIIGILEYVFKISGWMPMHRKGIDEYGF